MHAVILQRKDVILPFTLFSIMIEIETFSMFGVHIRFTLPIGLSGRMNFQPANYTQGGIEACLFSIDFLLLCEARIDHIQQILWKTEAGKKTDSLLQTNMHRTYACMHTHAQMTQKPVNAVNTPYLYLLIFERFLDKNCADCVLIPASYSHRPSN